MEACQFLPTKNISKVMVTVFWNFGGSPRDWTGQTLKLNGEYYASNSYQLKEAIMSKCRGKLRANVVLLQDNTPVHTAQVLVLVTETDRCLLSRFGTILFIPQIKISVAGPPYLEWRHMCWWRLSWNLDCRLFLRDDRNARTWMLKAHYVPGGICIETIRLWSCFLV